MAGTIMVGGRVAPVVPQSFEEVQRIAAFLQQTDLVPKALNTVPKIIAVMMKGLEVGFPPMQAIEVIALINGRMSIYGDGIPALIHASGLCEEFTEYFEGEGDEFKAVCIMRRKGSSQARRTEFSVADAKRARLWDTREKVKRKNFKTDQWEDVANDAPWFKYWKRMLQMRARGWCARDEFADVLRGIHIAEEVLDQERQIEQLDAPKLNPLVDPEPLGLEHSEVLHVDPREPPQPVEVGGEERDRASSPPILEAVSHDEAGRVTEDTPLEKKPLTIGHGVDAVTLDPFDDDFEPTRLIQFLKELEVAEDLAWVNNTAKAFGQYVSDLPAPHQVYFRTASQTKRLIFNDPEAADAYRADLLAIKEWVMAGCAS